MLGRRASLLASAVLGLAVALAYAYLDRALACRVPASEACVWGKAYFSLNVGLSIVLLGGPTTGAAYALLAWWRRKSSGRDAGAPLADDDGH